MIPFKGDLENKLEPLNGKAMPLTTKAKLKGSPLVSPSGRQPTFSPKKEIRFGALINNQRAQQIKQETIEMIERQKAEGVIHFMSS